MSIEYAGQVFYTTKKKGRLILDLSNQGIKDIAEIKGIENLNNLQVLNLNKNQITEINNLENLRNLETLYLDNNYIAEIKGLDNLRKLKHLLLNSNNITEIKGLGNLINLKRVELKGNPVRDSAKQAFGKYWLNPEPMVKFCRAHDVEIKVPEIKKKSREEIIQYIKKIGIAYEEITFEEMRDKTGYDLKELKSLTESLILDGEIEASIKTNVLNFKKAALSIATESKQVKEEVTKPKVIFVSYATKDAELFRVSDIARALEAYEEIEDVLFYEGESYDNFVKYMNDNLGKCDVVLLFCSPNALKSGAVEKEWTAADAMSKPIIPVFLKTDHIPPLLKSRLGVEFDAFEFQKNIEELYRIILKR